MPAGDFLERTFDFAARVIRAVESLPCDMVSSTLGKQFLRAGTSVGANARAARRARSRADFIAKMGIVEEEADEVCFWMDLPTSSGRIDRQQIEPLRREAEEILRIAVSSIKTSRANSRKPAQN